MKKILALFVFAASAFIVVAQEARTTISPEIAYRDDKRRDMRPEFLGADESGYYYVFTDHSTTDYFKDQLPTSFRKFDKSFAPKYNVGLELERFIKAFLMNGKFTFFTADHNKDEKVIEINCSFYDKSAKLVKKEKLYSLEEKRYDVSKTRIELSPDSSKILFLSYIKGIRPSGDQAFHLAIYDQKLNKLMDANCALPYTQEQTTFADWEITNDGDAFLMCTFDGAKNKSADGKKLSNYLNVLYRFRKDSKVPEEIPLKTVHPYYEHCQIQMDAEGANLHIVNFCRPKSNLAVDGIEYMRFNLAESKVTASSYQDLTGILILPQNLKEPGKFKGGMSELRLEIKKIVPHGNGGVTVLAEIGTSVYDYNGVHNNLHNQNIIIFHVDAIGEFKWMQVVPKRQTVGALLNSFAVMEREDDILIFYNEHEENIMNDLSVNTAELHYINHAVVAMIKISPEDGALTRSVAYKSHKQFILIEPSNCFKVSDEAFFISAFTAENICLGVVRLDE